MAHIISFSTEKFDVSKETPNPINPIPGQSVLKWIRQNLRSGHYKATEPDTEDWGWYMDVAGGEASYLVGASGEPDKSKAAVEWVIQIHKHRSIIEKLLGRNKMDSNDPLSTMIERLVRSEKAIKNVEVDKNA
ncbi:MAG: hypothetical protein HY924_00215 [Elusimicrobia bacterium]|nr:hypothetical protein [Elusimicrobiota bacterium]